MKARLVLTVLLAGGCAETASQVPRGSSIRVLTEGSCAQLAWPVDAPISSGFGRRDARPHLGIDLAVPEGTSVRAACAGVVSYAGDRLRGYGRLLIVEHHGGLATDYAHNQALLVAPGATVERGQTIARSGQTGRATAPHLHFEVREAGRAVDPLSRLAPAGRGGSATTQGRRTLR